MLNQADNLIVISVLIANTKPNMISILISNTKPSVISILIANAKPDLQRKSVISIHVLISNS